MKKSENITVSGEELRRLIMKEYGNVSDSDRIQHKVMEIKPYDFHQVSMAKGPIYDDAEITITFERNK